MGRYIGNEDGAPQHAELIGAHARAMKAVDPTLQAFRSWGRHTTATRLTAAAKRMRFALHFAAERAATAALAFG